MTVEIAPLEGDYAADPDTGLGTLAAACAVGRRRGADAVGRVGGEETGSRQHGPFGRKERTERGTAVRRR